MKGNLKKQIAYDLKMGIWGRRRIVLLYIVIVIGLCASITAEAHSRRLNSPMLMDYLAKIFSGMQEYSHMDRTESFKIPGEWVVIQMLYLLFVGIYPKVDFSERGYQNMIRSKRKVNWWISKCVWIVASTCLYYAVLYVVGLIFSFVQNGMNIGGNQDIWRIGISRLSNKQLFLALFILPMLVSCTYGMMQLVLSFIWSPIIGILALTLLNVASAYWCNVFLVGNYTMLYRNKDIMVNNGVNSETGVFLCGAIIIFCVLAGSKYFSKLDITLNKFLIK